MKTNYEKLVQRVEVGNWVVEYTGDGWKATGSGETQQEANGAAWQALQTCGAPSGVVERIGQLRERAHDRASYQTMSREERAAHDNQ